MGLIANYSNPDFQSFFGLFIRNEKCAFHGIYCWKLCLCDLLLLGVSMHDSLVGEEKTDPKRKLEQQRGETKSNEELYSKVSSFLEQFKSLEAGKEELKASEKDLKSTKERLEDAIRKVEQTWKVDNKDWWFLILMWVARSVHSKLGYILVCMVNTQILSWVKKWAEES